MRTKKMKRITLFAEMGSELTHIWYEKQLKQPSLPDWLCLTNSQARCVYHIKVLQANALPLRSQ